MDSEAAVPVRDAVIAETVNAQASGSSAKVPLQAMIFANRAFQEIPLEPGGIQRRWTIWMPPGPRHYT
jgi:hypothetical protein